MISISCCGLMQWIRLIRSSWGGLIGWAQEMSSLQQRTVPSTLEEVVMHPVLKRTSLGQEVCDNYCLIANTPFLESGLSEWYLGSFRHYWRKPII